MLHGQANVVFEALFLFLRGFEVHLNATQFRLSSCGWRSLFAQACRRVCAMQFSIFTIYETNTFLSPTTAWLQFNTLASILHVDAQKPKLSFTNNHLQQTKRKPLSLNEQKILSYAELRLMRGFCL